MSVPRASKYATCFANYTTSWEISAIWLASSSGISAKFEIPTCENYRPFFG